jgi:hypothetical protein
MDVGGQQLTLHHFTPVKNSGTHRNGGWMGSRAGLDVSEKIKIFSPCRNSTPGSSSLWRSHNIDCPVPDPDVMSASLNSAY